MKIYNNNKENMKPIIYFNDKPTELEFKRYTGKLHDTLIEVIKQYPVDSLQKKMFDFAAENSSLSDAEIQKKLLESKEIDGEQLLKMLDGNKIDSEYLEQQKNTHIEFYRATLNTSKLKQEQIELINSPVNSDFWQEQDLAHIKACVTFFRSTYSIGK